MNIIHIVVNNAMGFWVQSLRGKITTKPVILHLKCSAINKLDVKYSAV